MMTLCFKNCLQASNLINITLHDVFKANEHKEIKDLFYSSHDKYNTFFIYDAKIIVINKQFYYQLKTFIEHVRLKFIDNDEDEPNNSRFLYTSSDNNSSSTRTSLSSEMKSTLVYQCLTRIIEKSEVFSSVKD